MKKIGISYYPDFYDNKHCKKTLDTAYDLGYRIIFTSLILNDYGFANTSGGMSEELTYFLDYAASKGFEVRADVTRKILYSLGASVEDLRVMQKLKIPVLRLDGGFNNEEIIKLTQNELGIKIEDNLSNYRIMESRIDLIHRQGNIQNYCACHNFYPRVDTGISLEDAIEAAKMFRAYDVDVGIFIGSNASHPDLNSNGQSIPTIEKHRYIPSEIQLMELLCTESFDYYMFGDSNPSEEELRKVSKAFRNYTNEETPFIEIPCYFEDLVSSDLETLTSLTFTQRTDVPHFLIRGCQSRGKIVQNKQFITRRCKGAITVDNVNSHQYSGEVQICMIDLPPSPVANVVGYVKPYAFHLLKYLNTWKIDFKLSR